MTKSKKIPCSQGCGKLLVSAIGLSIHLARTHKIKGPSHAASVPAAPSELMSLGAIMELCRVRSKQYAEAADSVEVVMRMEEARAAAGLRP